eukprot:SAG11_NODE_163_length_13928_cov_29.869188_11_plen_89_part_00
MVLLGLFCLADVKYSMASMARLTRRLSPPCACAERDAEHAAGGQTLALERETCSTGVALLVNVEAIRPRLTGVNFSTLPSPNTAKDWY